MKLQPRFPFVLLALACAPLQAQTSGQGDEAVFELSPFEVNYTRDRGYTATASLAGGRLSSDLRDTAAAVSVLTQEFLQDIGAASFYEAAKWAPNAVLADEVAQPNLYSDYSVQFRSLGSGFQSRNYFRWYVNSDTYNTARIEFSRGPNSLVFGDAGVGGVANVSSLQAYGTGQSVAQIQHSSFGGYRATFDHDLKVADNWFVRAAGVYQRFDDWRHIGHNDRDGAFLTTTFKPGPRTQVRAEVEWGEVDRVLTFGMYEMFAAWDGELFIDGPIPQGTPLRVLYRYNSDQLVYNSATPGAGILNWHSYGATFGNLRGITTYPQVGMPESVVLDSYKVTFQAPNAGSTHPFHTASAFFQHQFGSDLFVEVAANYQKQERTVKRWFFDGLQVEVNRVLPDGSPNPYAGQYFGQARYWTDVQGNEVLDIRASLAYLLNRSLTEQRFLATGGHRRDRFEKQTWELLRTNGPDQRLAVFNQGTGRWDSNTLNRIHARRYGSELGAPVLEPPSLDPVSGIESRMINTNSNYSEMPVTYVQGAVVGKWFKDRRLNTLVGIRHDSFKEQVNDILSDQREPVTNEFRAFGKDITTRDESVTSVNASAVYHMTRAFSIFAGYSESYEPGSAVTSIHGGSLPALVSNGQEGGVKLDLWNGRLVGTITYYRNEQENARINGEATNINKIWGQLDLQQNQVDSYQDRQSYSGSGWEFDFTAMPAPNWRLMFNLALPRTEMTEGLIDTRDYHARHIGQWSAELARLEAAGEAMRADVVANAILAVENRLDSFTTGRRLNDTFDYTANVFTRYYITEGWLNGFSVGGGANIRGDRIAGNRPGDAYDYIHSEAYTVYTLLLGYEFKTRWAEFSLQVNISNLLDEEIVRPTRFNAYRVDGVVYHVPDRFIVQPPRQFLFTVSARF